MINETDRWPLTGYWADRARELGLYIAPVDDDSWEQTLALVAYMVGLTEALRRFRQFRRPDSIIREMEQDLEWMGKVVAASELQRDAVELRWRPDWSEPASEDNPEYRLRGVLDQQLDREIYERPETTPSVVPGRLRWYLRGAGIDFERVTTNEEEPDA